MKYTGQLGHRQQAGHKRSRLSQPQIPVAIAQVPQKTDQQPHARAINVLHLGKVQNDAIELAQAALQRFVQHLRLFAGSDAAGAFHHVNRSNMTRFHTQ